MMMCGRSECGEEQFQCEDTGQCLDREYQCDGVQDCQDGSGEYSSTVQYTTVQYSTVQCTVQCSSGLFGEFEGFSFGSSYLFSLSDYQ